MAGDLHNLDIGKNLQFYAKDKDVPAAIKQGVKDGSVLLFAYGLAKNDSTLQQLAARKNELLDLLASEDEATQKKYQKQIDAIDKQIAKHTQSARSVRFYMSHAPYQDVQKYATGIAKSDSNGSSAILSSTLTTCLREQLLAVSGIDKNFWKYKYGAVYKHKLFDEYMSLCSTGNHILCELPTPEEIGEKNP